MRLFSGCWLWRPLAPQAPSSLRIGVGAAPLMPTSIPQFCSGVGQLTEVLFLATSRVCTMLTSARPCCSSPPTVRKQASPIALFDTGMQQLTHGWSDRRQVYWIWTDGCRAQSVSPREDGRVHGVEESWLRSVLRALLRRSPRRWRRGVAYWYHGRVYRGEYQAVPVVRRCLRDVYLQVSSTWTQMPVAWLPERLRDVRGAATPRSTAAPISSQTSRTIALPRMPSIAACLIAKVVRLTAPSTRTAKLAMYAAVRGCRTRRLISRSRLP